MGLYRRNMKSQASDIYPSPLFSPLPWEGGKEHAGGGCPKSPIFFEASPIYGGWNTFKPPYMGVFIEQMSLFRQPPPKANELGGQFGALKDQKTVSNSICLVTGWWTMTEVYT
jgi:hypothetical protein